MKRITVGILVLACACAPVGRGAGGEVEFQPGLEVFLEAPPSWVMNQRLGLITNHAGVDSQGSNNIDLLMAHPEMNLTALFAFEHGIRGDAPPGERIASGQDDRTGLPIHSLYGETYKPTPEMLRDVDVLLYDVQDSGARPYTRVSTMALAMEAAAEKGIPFIVLDRPNPLGGVEVEGNLLEPEYSSLVGMYPIPMRHGMTLGELARMYNAEFGIGVELTVIPMRGWSRATWFDETGMAWLSPSPNIRRLEAAIFYPGTVLLEGTNLSEGRGTATPFEQTGAPWLRASEVADSMNALQMPGVQFEPVQLSIDPEARKYPGQTIPGVRFKLIDRETYRPVETAVRLIDLIRDLHREDFEWRGANQREPNMLAIDRLAGTDRLRRAVEEASTEDFLASWQLDEQRFRELREPYLLYK